MEKLHDFLRRGFAAISLSHEAKWVCEDLKTMDFPTAQKRAEEILSRRKKGEPLAYILGQWDFRKLKLLVGKGVLIPRPETEELVEHVLEHIKKLADKKIKIADLGAGSGAIAFSVAMEAAKEVEVFAVEKSKEAFAYLQKNLALLPEKIRQKITLLHSDWEHAPLENIDVLVSNPPYVAFEEYKNLDPGVRDFEPEAALITGEKSDAHAAYKSLLVRAEKILRHGGALFFEFGPAQEGQWEKLIPPNFQWKTFKDLSGKERILSAFDLSPKSR